MSTTIDISKLRRDFQARYGQNPLIVFAPGRVNLVGDHIDYCGGSVLPMPIEHGTWVAAAPAVGCRVRAHSKNLEYAAETEAMSLDFIGTEPPCLTPEHWGRFVVGAMSVAEKAFGETRGLDLLVWGNIPASGLSSSASLSLALLKAIAEVYEAHVTPLELALLAQEIEHDFVGVQCGLMDQAVIALGEPGAALLFDCGARTGRSIALPAGGEILVADTGIGRTLASSAYNQRRRELAEGARRLGVEDGELARWRSSEEDIERLSDPTLISRVRHVDSEQQRVVRAARALDNGDWASFGELLRQSHRSLRDDYEVSCDELDRLAEALDIQDGCYGARMTGAGFGGAVVAAVKPNAVEACRKAALAAVRATSGLEPTVFVARSAGGLRRVE